MITIQGKGVSTGIAMGPLYFYRRAKTEITRYTVENTQAEWLRFKGAQSVAMDQLGELAEKARAEAGDEAAFLFETHQMMAEDLDYEEAIQALITEDCMNAEAAVSDTAEQFAAMFESMDDEYMKGRAADVKDVSARILGILCGVVQGGIDSDVPVLLASDDLAPSETIQLPRERILAFVTRQGSSSSHTAILARTLNIPSLVQSDIPLSVAEECQILAVDGFTGTWYADPNAETLAMLQAKQAEAAAAAKPQVASVVTKAPEKSLTSDGGQKLTSKELRQLRAQERAKTAPLVKELKRKVEITEKKIDELQAALDEASAELFNPTPTTDFAEVNRKVRTLQFEIDRYTAEWEEAAEKLENINTP